MKSISNLFCVFLRAVNCPAHNSILNLTKLLAGAVVLAAVPVQATNAVPVVIKTVKELRSQWAGLPADELRKTAESGNVEAMYVHGLLEMDRGREMVNAAFKQGLAAEPTGPVFKRDEVFARWENVPREDLLKAVANQNREAQYYWGVIGQNEGVARTRLGFDWIKQAANLGVVPAQHDVGMFYAHRMSYVVVDADYAEAEKWFRLAAARNYEESCHQLAELHWEGWLGRPDLSKTVELLQHCVDLECPRAAYQLAMLYASGNGEPRHGGETPAVLLRKALRTSIPLAQLELARRYRIGFGVDKNLVRSARLYIRASMDERLMWMHKDRFAETFDLLDNNGEPKPDNNAENSQFATALAIQVRAIKENDPQAMMEMAQLELAAASDSDARYVAHYWLSQAHRKGVAAAGVALNQLEKRMSEEEVKYARTNFAAALRLENETRK